MMYRLISQNEIEISGKRIKFPCSIMKDPDGKPFIVEQGALIIVNFYPKTQQESQGLSVVDMESNIWAFDSQGSIAWKVSPPTIKTDSSNPYTSVFEKDGKIFGGTWCGYDFEINTADGTVTPPKTPRRPW